MIARLQASGWWGQITGGHGTGKSALLAALLPALQCAGHKPLVIELHDGQRALRRDAWMTLRQTNHSLVVVDGYEQLSRWSRFRLKRLCRSRGFGLLVTAHGAVGLPPIYHTALTATAAEQIVQQFLAGGPALFTSAEFLASFERHGGNLRETLFDLYDLCERRRPASVSKSEAIKRVSNS